MTEARSTRQLLPTARACTAFQINFFYSDAEWTSLGTFLGRIGCYGAFTLIDLLRTVMKTSSVKRKPEPQQPKSAPIPLESIEDTAWELWLLVELLAPVRRRFTVFDAHR